MNMNNPITHNVSMDTLPDVLLVIVFSHLPSKDVLRCSMVNSRWYRLSLDQSLWKVVNLDSARIPLKSLAKLLSRGIRDLSLANAKVRDPLSWGKIFPIFSNKLHTLDLSSAAISPRGLGQLLKSTLELVCVRLKNCQINRIAVKAIASNKNLKVLDLSGCKLSTRGYELIFESCLMLEDVNLSRGYLDITGVDPVRSKTLRRLTVRKSGLHYKNFEDVVNQCPNLTHLDISGNGVDPREAEKLKNRLVELKNDQQTRFEENDYSSGSDSYYSGDESFNFWNRWGLGGSHYWDSWSDDDCESSD